MFLRHGDKLWSKVPRFLSVLSPFSRTVFKLYSHALPYSFWGMAKTNAFLCFFFQICTFMKVALISGAKVSEGTTAFFLLNLFFSIFFFCISQWKIDLRALNSSFLEIWHSLTLVNSSFSLNVKRYVNHLNPSIIQ